MAYISYSDGNISNVNTWRTTPNANLAVVSSIDTTTDYQWCPPFTTTAGITIDGLLMHCKRNRDDIGTVTIAFSENGGSTIHASCTAIISFLPPPDIDTNAWVFFRFGTPYTQTGSTNAVVGIMGSSNGNANFSIAHSLMPYITYATRSTIAPTDPHDQEHYVVAEITSGSGGSLIDRTLTIDTTDLVPWDSFKIGYHATVQFSTAASSDFILNLDDGQNIEISPYGTLAIGRSSGSIPASSTATLMCHSVINLAHRSNLYVYGASRTYWRCTLAQDASAGTTTLITDVSTGWKAGDVIVISATDGDPNHCEYSTLLSDASGQILTVSPITYSHSGTAPTAATIAVMNRNAKIIGDSLNPVGFIVNRSSTLEASWGEFKYVGGYNPGGGVQTNAFTIYNQDASTVLNLQYCSVHSGQADQAGILGWNTSGNPSNGVTLYRTVMYGIGQQHVAMLSSGGHSGWNIQECIFMRNYDSSAPILSLDTGSGTTVFSNNEVIGSQYTGVYFRQSSNPSHWVFSQYSNNKVNNCSGYALVIVSGAADNAEDRLGPDASWNNGWTIWATAGVYIEKWMIRFMFDGWTLFGNHNGYAACWNIISPCIDVLFTNCIFDGGPEAIRSNYGILFHHMMFGGSGRIHLENCQIGVTNPFSEGSIGFLPGNTAEVVYIRNGEIGDVENLVGGQDYMPTLHPYAQFRAMVRYAIDDSTEGAFERYGRIMKDTAIFLTANCSERLIPRSATNYLESSRKWVAIENGQTVTVSAVIHCSSDYNGDPPFMVVKRLVGAGIDEDTIIATSSGFPNTWELLNGNFTAIATDVYTFVICCNGTAGYVNVDAWGVQ